MNIQEVIKQKIEASLEKKGITESVSDIKVYEGQYVSAKAKSGK